VGSPAHERGKKSLGMNMCAEKVSHFHDNKATPNSSNGTRHHLVILYFISFTRL